MPNSVIETQKIGQSIWYDNIRRGMITSGELSRLVDLGITGLTSNPTIFEKAITGSADYDDALATLTMQGAGRDEIYESLTMEDIGDAADILRPVFERTGGDDGYASLEVNPGLAHDTDGTVEEAKRLYAEMGRPNLLVKVPATPEGVPAIRTLIGQGVNVNVTLIFSLDAYSRVMDAYIGGLEDLAAAGGDVTKAASVASFFVSRVDTAVDGLIDDAMSDGGEELAALKGKAAVSNAKLAYQEFKGTFGTPRFDQLRSRGARVQRPLWASTGTKNPDYSDVLYVEDLIGPNTVNTMPQDTLTAFLEHGTAQDAVEDGVADAAEVMEKLKAAGISMERVTDKLLAAGVGSFSASFDGLLQNIEEKSATLRAQLAERAAAGLGAHRKAVEGASARLAREDTVSRIWQRDHTVWNEHPREIEDRLGWLDLADRMAPEVDGLRAFADEVRAEEFNRVVLLGMGGSSLGPEVIRRTFGASTGYPELTVLDSTVPGAVKGVAETGDITKTLFLVSSKSGTTVEPNTLYAYFWEKLDTAIGRARAGKNFVAITDPGTPLSKAARDDGFRRLFEASADLGGRYSVLSHFGLVPAALTGVDVALLLRRARNMADRCAADGSDNPGAWLGAAIGAMTSAGRDKLTLLTSPEIAAFGLWAEQLLAESTGKEGGGVVPVANEPLLSTDSYSDDRLFVHLRLRDGGNEETDAAAERLAAAGHPLIRIDLTDRYDLGAEFFRWEFATAVAGSLLKIHPFDQPNVQQAKDETARMLDAYRRDGRLPAVESGEGLAEVLAGATRRDYIALLAYVPPSNEVDDAVKQLRRRISESHGGVATTFGYGPRYLHSTGQVHKGGPGGGIFVVATSEPEADVAIPNETHTFGVLADAQALGDVRALREMGRRVVRVDLGKDPASAIDSLAVA